MDEKIKELGTYIDNLRQEKNLGFNQLSKKSGVNAKTLNEIMYGKSKRVNPIYLIPEDDIVKNKKIGDFNFINTKIGNNNIMVGGNISSSTITQTTEKNEKNMSLDLTKLNEVDAESIRNIYNSLLKK